MSIFNKVLDIYSKYYICPHCLGRMFALLGTNTTNIERGNSLLLAITLEYHRKYLTGDSNEEEDTLNNLKILSSNARFSAAQKVLTSEGLKHNFQNDDLKECYLCQDIFDNLMIYVEKAVDALKTIQFQNFLIGTTLDSQIINNEDKFKSEFNLLEAESFKSHFNREVGKLISLKLNKSPEFINPEVNIIYSLSSNECEVNVKIKSLFIYGRYNKYLRGIPQTHWFCRDCQGKGCKSCNYSGKQYSSSVEEFISPEFIKQANGSSSKFHGAGREDIDVRMLGNGRPFILEIKEPQIRSLKLNDIQERINKKCKKKVKISDLRYTNKKEVVEIKQNAEFSKKSYRATCEINQKLTREVFRQKLRKLKNEILSLEINQRTPHRVNHRRADKLRAKKIFSIDGRYIKSNLFELDIEVQGGTYVKELIHGDKGRTTPSVAEIFEMPIIVKELDVMKILQ